MTGCTRLTWGVAGGVAALALGGCGVNFYSGRPTDVKKIRELGGELDRLRQQKEQENQQLREAKSMLEQRLHAQLRR